MTLRAALLALILALSPAYAVTPDEVLKDASLEARARTISAELRCLVCQNQSIDDSDASLAKELRLIVRERLTAGDSDAQIRDFLVTRYGEFVLLRPVMHWDTALLWGLPFLAVFGGGLYLFIAARGRRKRQDAVVPLSEAELRLLDSRLDQTGRS
jgi:cytochrome c-type biogenesis protein CcmH